MTIENVPKKQYRYIYKYISPYGGHLYNINICFCCGGFNLPHTKTMNFILDA